MSGHPGRVKTPRLRSSGPAMGKTPLTAADVLKMRALARFGIRRFEIARQFNVSPACAGSIIHGLTWGWLKDETSTEGK